MAKENLLTVVKSSPKILCVPRKACESNGLTGKENTSSDINHETKSYTEGELDIGNPWEKKIHSTIL